MQPPEEDGYTEYTIKLDVRCNLRRGFRANRVYHRVHHVLMEGSQYRAIG